MTGYIQAPIILAEHMTFPHEIHNVSGELVTMLGHIMTKYGRQFIGSYLDKDGDHMLGRWNAYGVPISFDGETREYDKGFYLESSISRAKHLFDSYSGTIKDILVAISKSYGCNKKITAVSAIRAVTGCSIAEGKSMIETIIPEYIDRNFL